MKRILLIRHAECDMNLHVHTYIGGQSNASPLTQLGRIQAAKLGRHLYRQQAGEYWSTATVYCSTAVRARDTAALMLEQIPGAPAATAVDGLLELDQGEWEGKLRAECYTPETLQAIAADQWNFSAPGGESQKQLEERVTRVITQQVLPGVAEGGPPALVVSHGLAIKCFLRGVLNSDPRMSWKISLDNTAITEVGWSARGWHIMRVNDTTHLALPDSSSTQASC